jgi:hypothetical protein
MTINDRDKRPLATQIADVEFAIEIVRGRLASEFWPGRFAPLFRNGESGPRVISGYGPVRSLRFELGADRDEKPSAPQAKEEKAKWT